MKLTIFVSLFFFLIFPLYAPRPKAPLNKLERQRGDNKLLTLINRKRNKHAQQKSRQRARDNKTRLEESLQNNQRFTLIDYYLGIFYGSTPEEALNKCDAGWIKHDDQTRERWEKKHEEEGKRYKKEEESHPFVR